MKACWTDDGVVAGKGLLTLALCCKQLQGASYPSEGGQHQRYIEDFRETSNNVGPVPVSPLHGSTHPFVRDNGPLFPWISGLVVI